MTKEELDIVFHRANEPVEDFAMQAGACDGIAFWKEKKEVTVEQAAALIRWQALLFSGEWDAEALRETRYLLRTKAELIRGGKGWVLVWDPGYEEGVQ